MTDKTCGSCINLMRDYIEDQNGYVGGACRVSLFGGKYRYVYSADACTEPLDLYEERTDSLEQWARDMLALIRAAKQHPIVLKPNAIRGGQIMQPDPDNVFAERLEALGVEP